MNYYIIGFTIITLINITSLYFILSSDLIKIHKAIIKSQKKSHYHLITFQRFSNSPESIFYEGNIATFILIEREMGRNTTLLNVLEVSEEDYNKSKHLDKKLERIKKNAIG